MQIRCSACQKLLKVTPQATPIRVKCPGCQTILQVPAAEQGGGFVDIGTPSSSDPFGDLPPIPNAAPSSFPGGPVTPRPTSPVGPAQQTPGSAATIRAKKKGFPVWGYVAIGVGILITAPILCCGVIAWIGMSRMAGTAAVVMTEGLQAIAPPASFPSLGEPAIQFPSGATMYHVSIRDAAGGAGSKMQLRVYLPAGEHADRSLPCVLIAPAGTPLLYGANVEGDDYHDETLPYCESGMVVIHYSIDGAIPDSVNMNDDQEVSRAMATAWPAFKESGGGIVNGRNALEFALAKIPSVDPNRICAAGHSSAGTLALMLAATEPRITHCVAYAPAYDCERRMDEVINDPMTRILLPGLKPFIEWYSPMNHLADFRCKMMIFHARDDSNVPFEDANRFIGQLPNKGDGVQFVQAASGGHYTPMISEGIPAAIEWFGGETN